MSAGLRRVRVRVEGTVQGVGFRPYVHRLAGDLGLAGFVLNDARGVVVEVEADGAAVDRFLERLAADAPPLASVERVEPSEMPPLGDHGFAILASERGDEPSARIAPDAATCDDCLAELRDPADRRFRYPFVNCTACGPRFTIVLGVPYDRATTTMAGFAMCDRCRAEYEDPADRRFHAEPNACPECGPSVRLAGEWPIGRRPIGQLATDPVAAAAAAIDDGAIAAVKGLGGFHLACRADDEDAVARLRARKRREEKPFAIMAADLATARRLARLGSAEEALLNGRDRPIVLASRRPGAAVAAAVAPGTADLGLMLPYSPLHHLLLGDAGGPLVMTSGNVSDEPIAHRDEDALERLAGIADLFLLHDRPIATRTDDSVVRPAGPATAIVMRRSRGRVPGAIDLPVAAERPLLACGAELKSTFCLARGRRAWVSHHIGDLGNWETLLSFREGVAHFERLFAVEPEVVVHDLHPDYLSTRYALEREGVETVAVPHHHAHLAACLAEHGWRGLAVGAIYDGAGLGPDGTVWGGEILAGDLAGSRRAAHLRTVRLPGGDAAAREPWRMACAWLQEAAGADPGPPAALAGRVDPATWDAVARLARSERSPVTSSAGRLFDAVAAICGLRAHAGYEGQAAIALEAACDPAERGEYPIEGLDPRAAVLAAAADVAAGRPAGAVAARFHNALATATAEALVAAAGAAGAEVAVLSGGVFQNRRLLEGVTARLGRAGLRPLVPALLPPNDGGVAYGQAAAAAAAAYGGAHVTSPETA
ncbi:MAG TPA: carbamoyltransferase HypF [Miltoncostaeaceae bacterium]|nr:carbamoyltransferase HypF [Miltoncostaeaceae bacterium]